mmetsp:Transcript_4583/g.17285  ORF Transcript_4583/g.17285 Transcript_4583/m.17285 type:complete len:213 (-) Transcript_4583:103-741(-)
MGPLAACDFAPFCKEDDAYDPRKPEYVVAATPEEIEEARTQLLQQQIAKLDSALAKSKHDGSRHQHVRRHYRRVLHELESQVPPGPGRAEQQLPRASPCTECHRSALKGPLFSDDAVGKAAGVITGTLLGFGPAPFTFGLSIPLGAFVGLCVGAVVRSAWTTRDRVKAYRTKSEKALELDRLIESDLQHSVLHILGIASSCAFGPCQEVFYC